MYKLQQGPSSWDVFSFPLNLCKSPEPTALDCFPFEKMLDETRGKSLLQTFGSVGFLRGVVF